jgi:hypothetical protein
MKRYLFFLALLLQASVAQAQLLDPPKDITSGEYFWDTDPGFGNGTAIQVFGELGQVRIDDLSIDYSRLTPGFHAFYLRFKDVSGTWGIPVRLNYYVPEERVIESITKAEFFVDSRVEGGAGISVPVLSDLGTATIDNAALSADDLAKGFRKIYVRFGDEKQWGIPWRFDVFVPTERAKATVTRAEYFLDNLGAAGSGDALAIENPATEVPVNASVPIGESSGFRRLFLRFGDDSGWGLPVRAPFFQSAPRTNSEITAMEYFFSGTTRPAPGSGNAFEPEDGTFNSLSESGVSLARITQAAGNAAVYARARDASGVWGIPSIQPYTVASQRVIEGQVYVPDGSDSTFAAGITVRLSQNGTLILSDTSEYKGFFSFQNLSAGTYTVQGFGTIDPVTGIQAVTTARTVTLTAATPQVISTTGVLRKPATVLTVSDGKHGTNRETSGAIRISYNDALNPSTIANKVAVHSATQGSVPVTVSIGNNDSTLVITPLKPLASGSRLDITVSGGMLTTNGAQVLPFASKGWTKVRRGVNDFSLNRSIENQSPNAVRVRDLATGDLDGDTDMDVIALQSYQRGSNFTDSLLIKLNDGTGSFPARTSVFRLFEAEGAVLNAQVGNPRIELSDWDKDGDLDLLVFGSVNNIATIILYRNNGTGQFTRQNAVNFGSGSASFNTVVSDVNHDGYPDILGVTGDFRLLGITNAGDGALASPVLIHTSNGLFNTARLLAGDFSNDGINDLIVNNQSNRTISLYRGNGSMFTSSQFTPDSAITYATNILPIELDAIDWNNDGFLDLYALDDQSVVEWRNNKRFAGINSNSATRTSLTGLGLYPTGSYGYGIGDIDNDGSVDIVHTLNGSTTSYLVSAKNTQQQFGHMGTFIIEDRTSAGRFHKPRLVDIDNDGDLDIVVANGPNSASGSDVIRVYVNAAVSTNRAPVLTGTDLKNDRDVTIGSPFVRSVVSDFTDADGDVLSISATSSNTGIATASVAAGQLTVTGLAAGFASITVTANDLNGGVAITNFTVYVSPPGNRVPRLVAQPRDTTIRQADPAVVITLTSYFTDPDGTALSYSVSNSNTTVGTASIVNNNQLRFAPATVGNTSLTITASDGTLSASTTIKVTVTENVNRQPVLARALRDTTFKAWQASAFDVALGSFFSDPDGDVLNYSAISSSTGIATVQILTSPSRLRISPSITAGQTTITITAADQGQLSVQGQIRLTKTNDTPALVKAFRDTSIIPSAVAPYEIVLQDYIVDPDGEPLTYTASSNNTTNATVSILATTPARLRVSPSTTSGAAIITVRGTDAGGLFAQSTFTVSKGNRAPSFVKALRDTTLQFGISSSYDIPLDIYFQDPDGDAITYSVFSSNSNAVGAQILTGPNRLRVTPSATGFSTLTVTARDPSNLSISGSFLVTVKSAPRAIATMNGTTVLTNESGTLSYSLTSLFADNDNTANQWTTTFTSSNANIATFQRSANNILVFSGSTAGTAVLTVRVTDPDGFQSPQLTLSVTVAARTFTQLESSSEASYYAEGIPAKQWALFSIPGQLSDYTAAMLFQDLSGDTPYKLYDLQADGTILELPTSSTFTFAKGYWFKTLAKKSAFNIKSQSGSRYSTRTYTGNYGTGWRFIGSPFDVSVNWNFTSNSGIRRMWRFDHTTQNWVEMTATDRVQPWTGYLVLSSLNNGVTLSIPTGVTATSGAKAIGNAADAPEEPVWTATLRIGEQQLVLGEAQGAEEGEDMADYPLLPPAPESKSKPVYLLVGKVPSTRDIRPLELSADRAAQRAHRVYLNEGTASISAHFEGSSGDRALLLHGEGVFVQLTSGDSRTVTVPKSGWYTIQTGTPEMLERHALPQTAQLMDAYPNPFNPSTTLRFALPNESAVKLEVFDITGRRVQVAVDRLMNAGYHTVLFDAKTLSSGMYLYRLSVNGQTIAAKKMTLLK